MNTQTPRATATDLPTPVIPDAADGGQGYNDRGTTGRQTRNIVYRA